MSIYPSPDKLDSQESKFALVILAAKRARQIKDGARKLVETRSPNPLTVGLEEIAAGMIISRQVEDATVTAFKDALKPNEPTLEDIIGAGPVLSIETDPDSPAGQLAALRIAEPDEDDMDDELRSSDAFSLDASGLMVDPDDEDEEEDNDDVVPGMDEDDD